MRVLSTERTGSDASAFNGQQTCKGAQQMTQEIEIGLENGPDDDATWTCPKCGHVHDSDSERVEYFTRRPLYMGYRPNLPTLEGPRATACTQCVEEHATEIDGYLYANALVHQCRNCAASALDLISVHRRGADSQYIDVCSYCLDEDWQHCCDIDEYVHRDYAHYNDDDGDYYAEEREQFIYGYSTNVLDICGRDAMLDGDRTTLRAAEARGLLLMGVEVETAARDGDPEAIASACINAGLVGICKSDASVSGPEMVSLPATLEAHRQRMNWGAVFAAAINAGGQGYVEGDSEIGMHVHVSRAALAPATIGKLGVFLHNGRHERFLRLIAQRDFVASGYAKQYGDKKTVTAARYSHGRYEILNLEPSHTVEFRLFRATLRVDRFLKNLEFVHSLVTWVQTECGVNPDGLTQARYLAWLFRHARPEYENLRTFLRTRLGASLLPEKVRALPTPKIVSRSTLRACGHTLPHTVDTGEI